MKAVSKILLLQLVLMVLFTQCEKEHNPVNIPDNAFLNALIEEGVDNNGDGLISFEEAEVITYLDVSDKGISDLSGIESFVNLDTLYCYSNQLTYLDISNNTSLLFLNCHFNQLTNMFHAVFKQRIMN